jgi:hypothetical protein
MQPSWVEQLQAGSEEEKLEKTACLRHDLLGLRQRAHKCEACEARSSAQAGAWHAKSALPKPKCPSAFVGQVPPGSQTGGELSGRCSETFA